MVVNAQHYNARKTHCKRGHPLDGANLIMHRRGGRQCLACNRQRARDWQRQRAARRAGGQLARQDLGD